MTVTGEHPRMGVRGQRAVPVTDAFYAAVPGTAGRITFVPRTAAGISLGTGSTAADFVWLGHSPHESSPPYFRGFRGEALGRSVWRAAWTFPLGALSDVKRGRS